MGLYVEINKLKDNKYYDRTRHEYAVPIAVADWNSVEAEPIVHAHWELRYENIEHDDGWTHNRCSHCKHDAIFYPTFSEDWDEDIDGEWVSLGTFQDGIEEFLTDYCPFCGAKMDELNEEKVIK